MTDRTPPPTSTAADAFWLGENESSVGNWGGPPRRAVVVGRPTLATGESVVLVHVEPPLPRAGKPPIDDVIVMARYVGESLDRIGEMPVTVNIMGPAPGVDLRKTAFDDGDLVIAFWAEAAASPEMLPKPVDEPAFWAETLARIRRFIEDNGHSRVPDDYHDADGRLDVIVGNLRWHHAGKGGVSPGPFPGIDYAADLDRLPGWEW